MSGETEEKFVARVFKIKTGVGKAEWGVILIPSDIVEKMGLKEFEYLIVRIKRIFEK